MEAGLIGFAGIPPLREELTDLMATTDHWLGRRIGGELVAALAYAFPDDDTVDITRLIVDPEHFRNGHARALPAHLERLHPRPRSTVSTGAADTPAVSLYLSLGYRERSRTRIAPDVHLTHFTREPGPVVTE